VWGVLCTVNPIQVRGGGVDGGVGHWLACSGGGGDRVDTQGGVSPLVVWGDTQ